MDPMTGLIHPAPNHYPLNNYPPEGTMGCLLYVQ